MQAMYADQGEMDLMPFVVKAGVVVADTCDEEPIIVESLIAVNTTDIDDGISQVEGVTGA